MPLTQQNTWKNRGRWLPGGVLLLGVMLLAGFLMLAIRDSGEAAGSWQLDAVKNAMLCPFPGADTNDESAVRWDYRYHSNNLIRWDNRHQQRVSAAPPFVVHKNELVVNKTWNIILPKQHSGHIDVKFFYYRRLWQKVLPVRAGPDMAYREKSREYVTKNVHCGCYNSRLEIFC